jgi:hypothetical protein
MSISIPVANDISALFIGRSRVYTNLSVKTVCSSGKEGGRVVCCTYVPHGDGMKQFRSKSFDVGLTHCVR